MAELAKALRAALRAHLLTTQAEKLAQLEAGRGGDGEGDAPAEKLREVVERAPLLLDDVAKLLGDVVVDPAEVVAEAVVGARGEDQRLGKVKLQCHVLVADDCNRLLVRADQALYRAKRDGRNRIELAAAA